MMFRTLKNMITSRDVSAQFKTFGIMKMEGSLIFYHAGIETGMFAALEKPSTLEELATTLGVKNGQLLSSLLDLGCSLKEISCRNGKYRLQGAMARALAHNVPVAELVRETVRYHGHVACTLHAYLLTGRKGDYLKEFGGVIAESSRLTEPMIKAFIYHSVKKSARLDILEIGCGSGEYLKYYADINSGNRGVAIDADASAVAIARRKLAENGIEKNFSVMHDNIMNPQSLDGMTFDLVTSYSNIYYFPDEERPRLFRSIRELLRQNGRFMLATAMKTKRLSSSYYDLLFSATQGLYPLPRVDDIVRDLKKAGFGRVHTVKIAGASFMGIVAHR